MLDTRSFSIRFERCISTVRTPIFRDSAICRLDRPSTTSSTTSLSRRVSAENRSMASRLCLSRAISRGRSANIWSIDLDSVSRLAGVSRKPAAPARSAHVTTSSAGRSPTMMTGVSGRQACSRPSISSESSWRSELERRPQPGGRLPQLSRASAPEANIRVSTPTRRRLVDRCWRCRASGSTIWASLCMTNAVAGHKPAVAKLPNATPARRAASANAAEP